MTPFPTSTQAQPEEDTIKVPISYQYQVPYPSFEMPQYERQLKPIPRLLWRLFGTGVLLMGVGMPFMLFFPPMLFSIYIGFVTFMGCAMVSLLAISGFWLIWFDDLPPFVFDVE